MRLLTRLLFLIIIVAVISGSGLDYFVKNFVPVGGYKLSLVLLNYCLNLSLVPSYHLVLLPALLLNSTHHFLVLIPHVLYLPLFLHQVVSLPILQLELKQNYLVVKFFDFIVF